MPCICLPLTFCILNLRLAQVYSSAHLSDHIDGAKCPGARLLLTIADESTEFLQQPPSASGHSLLALGTCGDRVNKGVLSNGDSHCGSIFLTSPLPSKPILTTSDTQSANGTTSTAFISRTDRQPQNAFTARFQELGALILESVCNVGLIISEP